MEDWENKTTNKKKVELAFPKVKTEENDTGEYVSKGRSEQQEGGAGGLLERFSTSIEDVTDWFKQYQVDTIELWISGVIETAGVTRLVVSAKGEGGLRVVLKPKSQVA
jgi:hypothetical protein